MNNSQAFEFPRIDTVLNVLVVGVVTVMVAVMTVGPGAATLVI